MSIRSTHPDDNVHQKRQRTASQDSTERGPAKKARSGPPPQLKSTEVNLSNTVPPHQSTRRRAASDIGHNTKQDWSNFLCTSEGRYCLPDSPLPSANPPERLPLTEESLRLLDNGCLSSDSKTSGMPTSNLTSNESAPEGNMNAYHPDYLAALEFRQVFFADEDEDGRPPGLDKWWTTLLAPRESPEPDQTSIKSLRRVIGQTTTESDTMDGIVSEVITTKALKGSAKVVSVTNREWKSMLNTELEPCLTPPRPDKTIGWGAHAFTRKYPKACASLNSFMFPIKSERTLAWPLFTIEAKGASGTRAVARLQNLHNGAIMLSNIYALKQMCGAEESFFDKVHVMGVEFFEGCVELSCYWATRSETGEIRYLGESLQTWCLLNSSGEHFKEARSCIHNAMEWVRSEAEEWIRADLQAIEDKLTSIPLSQLTPPVSRSVRSLVRKGCASKSNERTSKGTQSTSLPDPH